MQRRQYVATNSRSGTHRPLTTGACSQGIVCLQVMHNSIKQLTNLDGQRLTLSSCTQLYF